MAWIDGWHGLVHGLAGLRPWQRIAIIVVPLLVCAWCGFSQRDPYLLIPGAIWLLLLLLFWPTDTEKKGYDW